MQRKTDRESSRDHARLDRVFAPGEERGMQHRFGIKGSGSPRQATGGLVGHTQQAIGGDSL
jgi:hypothetical protein